MANSKITFRTSVYRRIHVYKDRKAEMRAKYPDDAEFKERTAYITKRIRSMQRSLRLIEKKRLNIQETDKLVCQFMDLGTLKNTSSDKRRHMSDAKKLFCTYAIDNKCGDKHLAEFLGCSSAGLYRIRSRFKKSFKTNQHNRELWHRFKLFLTDINHTNAYSRNKAEEVVTK